MTNSISILTNTKQLPKEELERLTLSNCRCPDMDKHDLMTIEDLINMEAFTPKVINIVTDVSDITYYPNGDFTYVEYQFRNLEQLIESVVMDNEETAAGNITGLIESDLTNLTTLYVIPTSVVTEHAQLQFDIRMEATLRSFRI